MAGYISNYGAGGFDAFASKLDVNGNISNCLICSDIDIAVQTLDISSSEQTADIDLAAQTSDISSSEQTADIDLAKLTLDVVPSEAIVCPGP